MTISLEPATAADLFRLTELVRTSAAYDGEYRMIVAELTVEPGYLERNLVRVARDLDGVVAGFFSLLVPGCGADGEGELDMLFVADDRRGQGLGKLLMADLFDHAKALYLKRIHVVSHPPAEAFYRSCGGRVVGMRPPRGVVTWTRPHLVFEIES
jgi:GNAT superfamily N-acetyltransferase